MKTIRKQTDPPWAVAIGQAAKSIRMRLVRQAAAALGVLLGIAFYASVRTSALLTPPDPADPASLEAGRRLQWLAFLSLIMCMVGITNAMLMSVTERYKEIGTLKCLGATNNFIVRVFFLEALMIGVVASLLGAGFGIGLMLVVRSFTDGFDAVQTVDAWELVAIFGVSVGIGLALTAAAAIAPAIQAARMPAAAALRVEI